MDELRITSICALIACIISPLVALTTANKDFNDDDKPFVTTARGGKIIGSRVDFRPYQLPDITRSAAVYRGIPYAQPPTGEHRFRPPITASEIEGDYDTTTRGPVACLQPSSEFMREYMGELENSEDCLYLDIYVPESEATPSPRPVMVWFHGGGYLFGMGSGWGLQPFGLAILGDVIVVTLNYRLGPLGFLTTGDDDLPANLGLLDQRQALLWVRDHIAAFGGDPTRVTIFGESAGGSAVNLHLLSPLSEGLFHRAIVQSGALNEMFSHHNTLDDAASLSREFSRKVGCGTDDSKKMAVCLRDKPWQEFERVLNEQLRAGGSLPFRPVPDGHMLPAGDLYEAAASGRHSHRVPVMVGSLSDEGDLLIIPNLFSPDASLHTGPPTFNRAEFRAALAASLRVDDPLILDMTTYVYSDGSKLTHPRADFVEALSSFVGDTWFVCPANALIRSLAPTSPGTGGPEGRSGPVYSYFMTHTPNGSLYGSDLKWARATHGEELPFVFAAPLIIADEELARSKSYMGMGRFDETDVQMSLQMIKYWSNFAKTGNPNLSVLDDAVVELEGDHPIWPHFDPSDPTYKELSNTFPNQAGFPRENQCYFLDNILPRLVQNERKLAHLRDLFTEKVAQDGHSQTDSDVHDTVLTDQQAGAGSGRVEL